tara:strand:- start:567 stop:1286 length:720 start_codon:yes stop_codon:yes gene_type:complete
MKVKALANIVRPLIFDNEYEGYEHNSLGSCVVIEYASRYFAITALHNNQGDGYEPKQFMVPHSSVSNLFFPMKEVFSVETSENEDTDHKDVFFIEIPREDIEEDKLDLDTIINFSENYYVSSTGETKYIVHGFPDELQEINFDKKVIKNQRFAVSGKLHSRECYLGIDQIKFDGSAGLNSFSGMSGGGVFSLTPNGDGRFFYKFEGILLRGTATSLMGYVLKREVIQIYLEKFIGQENG